nr:hypothetical protein [Tanacetum cinerariifolium]
MHYLTNDEITEHLEKEGLIKKAVEQARLIAITQPEMVKVVRKEAAKIGIDPERITSLKESGNITKLDELMEIIPKKKNMVVKDLMNSLRKRYERIKKIPKELGIQSALPAPILEQASSKSLRRKRKHIELEPEVKVPEPEYEIFFTDVFGDQAFQRWNDIHKHTGSDGARWMDRVVICEVEMGGVECEVEVGDRVVICEFKVGGLGMGRVGRRGVSRVGFIRPEPEPDKASWVRGGSNQAIHSDMHVEEEVADASKHEDNEINSPHSSQSLQSDQNIEMPSLGGGDYL